MDISDSNSSKKRKIHREKDEEEQEQEQEQEDEAKMETFFALVKSIRESRDRWISFRSGDHSKNKMSKNIVNKEENRVEVWKPTFQLEDFAQEDLSVTLLAGSSSQSNNCHKEEDAEKGIDLKLSL
ncbi:NRR repressor homolog 3-like [Gastrolobium bilobum]|uniref:NRR repressor homolog 3-like n=1 Tax=Gastrolobium bilobum TaxID=150636 RepID=UPI002AB165C3|nr:NRR repressor homolog 3-like [Gastrolobium bilobum]